MAESEARKLFSTSATDHPYDKLTKGYLAFRWNQVKKNPALFEPLKTGQSPKVMVIACCDSRVAPETIFSAAPGELFVVRNIANLVPAMDEPGMLQHSTSAAIEYAVLHLGVEHIVVEGHRGCGGIKALMTSDEGAHDDHHTGHKSYIPDWMKIAAKTKEQVLKRNPKNQEEALRFCEKASLERSMRNLMTFPWIKERLVGGRLSIHVFLYDFVDGTLMTKSEGKGAGNQGPMWQTFNDNGNDSNGR